jgi:hypothetical protein
MNPTIELRLRTMIRALNETIIPAVDPNDSLAQEQAGLLLGHLHVLLQHEGQEKAVSDVEHAALKELADTLIHASSGGSATAAATEHVRQLLDEDTDTLSHAIEALIIDAGIDGSDGFKATCDSLVIEHGREATRRSRIWFKSMGFDHEPDAIPEIGSLLSDD